MAQILDLSKIYTKEQLESATKNIETSYDLPTGGYVCKIVKQVLNNDPVNEKANKESDKNDSNR